MNHNNNLPLGLPAIKSDGTPVSLNSDGTVTLADGQTYYFPIGEANSEMPSITALLSIHAQWAAALRATLTLELANFGARRGTVLPAAGAVDLAETDLTAGGWIPVGASNGHVDVVAATAAGLSIGTITAAGGAFWTLPDFGARRLHVKAAVVTGANLRVLARGKLGL